MTSTQITRSVKTGKLQLEGWERFRYFENIIWLAIGSAGCFLYALYSIYLAEPTSLTGPVSIFLLVLSFVLFVLAAVQFVILDRSRKLALLTTNLRWTEAREILLALASRRRWTVLNNRKAFIRLRTRPSWWFSLSGEQITVFYNRKNIWAASICDPDGPTAIITRNRENILLLRGELSGSRRSSLQDGRIRKGT